MRRAAFYLLAILTIFLHGCGGDKRAGLESSASDISKEEKAGLDILSEYAAILIKTEGFPNLDLHQATKEDDVFRKRLNEACSNAIEAEVLIGDRGYLIGPRSKETIAGERTNWVNPRIVHELDTPGVTGHYEIDYDYTTLDGDSGSIPATLLAVDRIIEGQEVRLIFSTERTQKAWDGDAEEAH